MTPLLSILVPSVFERAESGRKLHDELFRQVSSLPVEILWLTDNRRRTLGKKREALLSIAKGQFIVHLDDDDWIAPWFCTDIIKAIAKHPDADVICYNQESTINGAAPFLVETGIEFENQPAGQDADGDWRDIRRKPWHWCTWNREFCLPAKCQDGSMTEDAFWLSQLWPRVVKQVRINKVLHYYRFEEKKSLCQTDKLPGQ